MDGFVFVILGCGAAVLVVLIAVGKWHPMSGADVLDWKPTRSLETEIELELDDVDQMIEAQNERRRRTGRPEITEESVRTDVETAQREADERRARYQQGREPS
jgi:hypothetical protein